MYQCRSPAGASTERRRFCPLSLSAFASFFHELPWFQESSGNNLTSGEEVTGEFWGNGGSCFIYAPIIFPQWMCARYKKIPKKYDLSYRTSTKKHCSTDCLMRTWYRPSMQETKVLYSSWNLTICTFLDCNQIRKRVQSRAREPYFTARFGKLLACLFWCPFPTNKKGVEEIVKYFSSYTSFSESPTCKYLHEATSRERIKSWNDSHMQNAGVAMFDDPAISCGYYTCLFEIRGKCCKYE